MAIRDITFHIASLAVKTKSYEEMERETEPLDAFRLVFRTPTYSASLGGSYHWVFPDPVRVFSGLMRLWGEFSTNWRVSKGELKGGRGFKSHRPLQLNPGWSYHISFRGFTCACGRFCCHYSRRRIRILLLSADRLLARSGRSWRCSRHLLD